MRLYHGIRLFSIMSSQRSLPVHFRHSVSRRLRVAHFLERHSTRIFMQTRNVGERNRRGLLPGNDATTESSSFSPRSVCAALPRAISAIEPINLTHRRHGEPPPAPLSFIARHGVFVARHFVSSRLIKKIIFYSVPNEFSLHEY